MRGPPYPMKEALDFVQQLIDRIGTLETNKLIALGSLALGYVLRHIPKFPNDRIPPATCLFLVVAYPVASQVPGQAVSKYVVDVTMAIILWAVTWGFYEWILKPLEKKFLGGGDGKPPPPATP